MCLLTIMIIYGTNLPKNYCRTYPWRTLQRHGVESEQGLQRQRRIHISLLIIIIIRYTALLIFDIRHGEKLTDTAPVKAKMNSSHDLVGTHTQTPQIPTHPC